MRSSQLFVRRRRAHAAAALALSACSTVYPVSIERLEGGPAEPHSSDHVEVLWDSPSRPFVEVARLGTQSVNYDSPSHALSRLRSAAAELGADALLVEGIGIRPAGVRSVGSHDPDFGFVPPVSGPPSQLSYASEPYARGVALRWTGPDPFDAQPGVRATRAASHPASRPEGSAPARPEDSPFATPELGSRPAR